MIYVVDHGGNEWTGEALLLSAGAPRDDGCCVVEAAFHHVYRRSLMLGGSRCEQGETLHELLDREARRHVLDDDRDAYLALIFVQDPA